MTHHAISRLPAILIGGPPHAGKSVLANNLKRELKQAEVQFYHFSATPDGEGDWSQEVDPIISQRLRQKRSFTLTFVEQVCQDIDRRPLPFLIDVGGKPQSWQEKIFDHCTHAILLVTDDASQQQWLELMKKWNVIVIAILRSELEGEAYLESQTPHIAGTITGLHRHQTITNGVFEALLQRVKALFHYQKQELSNLHQSQCPVGMVADLAKIYRQCYPDRAKYEWQPQDITALLEYLPHDVPLALYGAGPTWVYAAVAAMVMPQLFYQFDARLGWVKPLEISPTVETSPEFEVQVQTAETMHFLEITTPMNYLLYQPPAVQLPQLSGERGIVLSCKLPLWLQTSFVLAYHQAPWVALYEPRFKNQAIVVATTRPDQMAIGQVITLDSTIALPGTNTP